MVDDNYWNNAHYNRYRYTYMLIHPLILKSGIGSKMGAVYGTGYNNYYCVDMVTNIPNAYFSQVGIYKWIDSPTYTLGRGTSFGAAFHYR